MDETANEYKVAKAPGAHFYGIPSLGSDTIGAAGVATSVFKGVEAFAF